MCISEYLTHCRTVVMIGIITVPLEKLKRELNDPVEAALTHRLSSHLVISALFLLLFILSVSILN